MRKIKIPVFTSDDDNQKPNVSIKKYHTLYLPKKSTKVNRKKKHSSKLARRIERAKARG